MRIYQLFHELIAKFVPMDQVTQNDLQLEAVNYYNDAVFETKKIDEANKLALEYNKKHENDEEVQAMPLQSYDLKHRIIKFFEAWYMRYLIAIAFIYLVPLIKSYISGESRNKGDDLEEEDDYDEAEMFKEYMKFKRSMR